ncbi:MAG: ATPase [Lachnospiraceae bacterium]|nr:ATPase [Lachnospiraceae bacterium]
MDKNKIAQLISEGKAVLGIEFGSTRIKGVLIDEENNPIAQGGHEWENRFENGIWTYSLDDIWDGLADCYADMKKNVQETYGVEITKLAGLGISGMMHGYMPFDKAGNLLYPFRTWRNTITGNAAKLLTEMFDFNIPQRWTISHCIESLCFRNENFKDVDYVLTLAGYVHYMLTGVKAVGIGEASGIFPIDSETLDYDKKMLDKIDNYLAENYGGLSISKVLPKVLVAGENAGYLTEEGAKRLDRSGKLEKGCPVCPCEGDAGTGMVATNSVKVRTGNVSAGTSVFAMVVLEKALKKVHEEIDLVTTPSGEAVGMVHCNNCTSDINAWVSLFGEVLKSFGALVSANDLYTTLFNAALDGAKNGGGLMSYNYFSGEHVTGFTSGRPLFTREENAEFTLANFMRVQLYTALGALKTGLDIMQKEENVKIDSIFGHGGFFKTKDVGQKILAAAIDAPVSVMATAGEGGAWGIAVLASYMLHKSDNETLSEFLENKVFKGQEYYTVQPDASDVEGFNEFISKYKKGLAVEKAAVENL